MVVGPVRTDVADYDRLSDWSRLDVVVAGLGTSGYAAADALLEYGANVRVLDESDTTSNQEKATILETLGARVELGTGTTTTLPANADLVVTSPGWRPDAPLLAQALATDVPVWGETELAWRLMSPDRQVPWLAITGTNGKTTTTQMLEAMLIADGRTAAAVGNIGRPVLEAMLDEVSYDVFAVELSSFQLHWSPSLRPHSSVVLNLHEDHLEWYEGEWLAGVEPMSAYAADKARIYHNVSHSCVYNVADPATEQMVVEADVVEGARAIGFTQAIPDISMIGVVDGLIVDRAFVEQRRSSALELASVDNVRPFAPHNLDNALAAAALARSFGVSAKAVKQGLTDVQLGGHRIQLVAEVDGARYVDDSKATNPHAANSSLSAFDSVVWLAGGQAKGTNFDDLVRAHAGRLRAAVLFGVDRQVIADAIARHAPDLPVIVLDANDTGVMVQAVQAARRLARPGDVVLLAPGCASKDMWSGYDKRGDDFAAAVRNLD